jgi:hypothetical protein
MDVDKQKQSVFGAEPGKSSDVYGTASPTLAVKRCKMSTITEAYDGSSSSGGNEKCLRIN